MLPAPEVFVLDLAFGEHFTRRRQPGAIRVHCPCATRWKKLELLTFRRREPFGEHDASPGTQMVSGFIQLQAPLITVYASSSSIFGENGASVYACEQHVPRLRETALPLRSSSLRSTSAALSKSAQGPPWIGDSRVQNLPSATLTALTRLGIQFHCQRPTGWGVEALASIHRNDLKGYVTRTFG